jgi:hypothetical protein
VPSVWLTTVSAIVMSEACRRNASRPSLRIARMASSIFSLSWGEPFCIGTPT